MGSPFLTPAGDAPAVSNDVWRSRPSLPPAQSVATARTRQDPRYGEGAAIPADRRRRREATMGSETDEIAQAVAELTHAMTGLVRVIDAKGPELVAGHTSQGVAEGPDEV